MVAIFVVLTIITFLLVDYVVQKIQLRRAGSNMPLPEAMKAEPDPLEILTLQPDSITVPSAFFFHRGHTWVKFFSPNRARVGLDDFAQKVLGRIEAIQFPRIGELVRQGDAIFMVQVGERKLFLAAPSDGIVTHINADLAAAPAALHSSPFENGWVCEIKPENVSQNVSELLSGEDAVQWELHELNRLKKFVADQREAHPAPSAKEFSLGRSWPAHCEPQVLNEFSKSFFTLDLERSKLVTEVS
jgi:glycine cleavage system H lipoate-binding protein